MAGSKVGESKWITAGKLIELLSGLHPDTMVVLNDHYDPSLYEPGAEGNDRAEIKVRG